MTKKFFTILLLSIIVVLSIVFLWTRSSTHIIVTPENALLDEPLAISITHLVPHETVTLEATCKGLKGMDNNVWKSSATFQADDKGVVNVATQAPASGSYKGIDPMGLFWSMMPTSKDPSRNTNDSLLWMNQSEAILSVFSEDKLRAQKTIYRIYIPPDVEIKMIREQGIIGTLFYPRNIKKGPGIITLSGSGCGIVEAESLLLASHGYAVLALAYCGMQGLPEKISLIPLEYFQNAMHWLKKQPHVDGNKIALMGQSTGAELVLLLASLFPGDMDACIAYSPSHLVHGDSSPEEKSAWTYNKRPVPFMPMPQLSDQDVSEGVKAGYITLHKGTIEDPSQVVQFYLYGMKKFSSQLEVATIPVEKIRCPILILCGDDDKMFPSMLSGKSIMERLDLHGSTIEKKLVIYPNTGNHIFMHPYVPAIDVPCNLGSVWNSLGGTTEGNALAHQQAWQEALEFLKKTLK